MNLNFSLTMIDEISMIFFWVGSTGIIEKMINYPGIKPSKIYIYMLLLLLALFIKIK